MWRFRDCVSNKFERKCTKDIGTHPCKCHHNSDDNQKANPFEVTIQELSQKHCFFSLFRRRSSRQICVWESILQLLTMRAVISGAPSYKAITMRMFGFSKA